MKTSIITAPLAALALLLASATVRAQVQSPPANDNFANRQVVPSQDVLSVNGTTIDATQEAFEKALGGTSPPGNDINQLSTVWYQWTPPDSGKLTATIRRNSDGETFFAIFKGTDTPVTANLVGTGYLPSNVGLDNPPPADIPVTGGQTYVISMGNTNYPDNFTLTLTLTPAAVVTPTPTPTLPVASVTAKVNTAARSGGHPGKLVFALSAAASADVTLKYKVVGTAVSGTDYKPLPGSVTLAAGKKSATVKIKPYPLANTDSTDSTATVKVKLQKGDGYKVGSENSAKVKIVDSE